MMKKHGLRRFFSLLLAVIMVCALLPTAALAEDTTGDGETQPKTVVVDEDGKTQKKEDTPPQNPEQGTPPADGDDGDKGSDSPALTSERGSRPVTITVRVFSSSTGASAVVGSDTAGAGNPGQIQSADYKIPPLTNFVDSSKFGRVTKVAGNWYFPTGDQQPGATVQWSTNSGTGTMTYWVDWYTPDGGGSTTYLWNFTLKYDAKTAAAVPPPIRPGARTKSIPRAIHSTFRAPFPPARAMYSRAGATPKAAARPVSRAVPVLYPRPSTVITVVLLRRHCTPCGKRTLPPSPTNPAKPTSRICWAILR